VRQFVIHFYCHSFQQIEYGAFGISTLQFFNLLLRLFIVIICIFSTIYQIYYILIFNMHNN